MAQRAREERPEPDAARSEAGEALGALVGPAVRAGVDPASPEGLAIVEQLEAAGSQPPEERRRAADRIDAFTDRRVARYWALVGVVNGWPPSQDPEMTIDAWEWYAKALRAHA